MSSIPSSLSGGLEVLSNAGLLPSSISPQQLQNASPAQLTQLAIDKVQLSAVSSMFGGTASSSESTSQQQNLAATLLGDSTPSNSDSTDSILQTLDTAVTNSGNAVLHNATNTSFTSSPSANTEPPSVGSLFNYLG